MITNVMYPFTSLSLLGSIPFLFSLVLAIPAIGKSRSSEKYFLSACFIHFGILMPLAAFFVEYLPGDGFASGYGLWKGNCRLGLFTFFYEGKFFLLPLFLWSSAALYAVICRTEYRPSRWIDLGLFTGAVTSTLCVLYVIVYYNAELLFLLIYPPLVTSIFMPIAYWILFSKHAKLNHLRPFEYALTILSWIPFWLVSIYWCWKKYLLLPDEPPPPYDGCFVVTAALGGHPGIVGPLVPHQRHGICRTVNQQLLTFWRFEDAWAARMPCTHRLFRRFYNWAGPRIARRVRSPFAADLVFLLLCPLQKTIEWSFRTPRIRRKSRTRATVNYSR